MAPSAAMEPRERRLVPPTDEERAAAVAEAARWRAEREAAEAALRPVRRRLFDASGITLRDVDAALGCHCGCHPRLDLGLHEGGARCPCQLTADERPAAWDAWLAHRPEVDHRPFRAWEEAIAARASELGVEARIACYAAPMVIAGTVDGRGFYLRERHGSWRVTVAPDDDPTLVPWSAPATRTTLDIAYGSEEELEAPGDPGGSTKALDVAVAAVRTYLRRRACAHADARRYCPDCGACLVDPAAP